MSVSKAEKKKICIERECDWFGRANSYKGVCAHVCDCSVYNLLGMKYKHRRNECRQSQLRCVFLNGVCQDYPETLQCKNLSQDKYGTKWNRKIECKALSPCVWSGVDNNYRGLCLNVSRCEDINGLSPVNSVRRMNCNKSPLDCLYFEDEAKCISQTAAPTPMKIVNPPEEEDLCAAINVEGVRQSERRALCLSEQNCVWKFPGAKREGRRHCEAVTSCIDINHVPRDLREDVCAKSSFGCKFVRNKCLPLDVCDKVNDLNFGSFDQRKEGCESGAGCVWSGSSNSGEGQCVKVGNCSDYNKFDTTQPTLQALCEASLIGCAYENNKCWDASITAAPTVPQISPLECSEYSKASLGPTRERRIKCRASKDCFWIDIGDEDGLGEDEDGEGTGKCYSVTGCVDYNQLPHRRNFRKTACLQSRFICTYSSRGKRCEDA